MDYQDGSLDLFVYDVLDIYNKGRVNKDSTVSYDQVAFWIISKREKYLKQKMAKGDAISNEFIQDLGCVPIDFVDRVECCDVDLDCKFLRTVTPIPDSLSITRVGPVDSSSIPFQEVQYDRVAWEKTAPKYSKKYVKYYTKNVNSYLYFYFDPEILPEANYLTTINLQGILVDPTQAKNYNNCTTGTPCYSNSTKFPMTLSLWEDIRRDILQVELRLTELTSPDDTNDNKANKDVENLRRQK